MIFILFFRCEIFNTNLLTHLIDAENGCNGRGIEDNLSDATVGLLTVEGQRKDLNTIFLKLRITDSKGFNLFIASNEKN